VAKEHEVEVLLKLEFVLIPNFLISTFDWPKAAKALSLLQGTYLRYR
jgi:hypothetical protein